MKKLGKNGGDDGVVLKATFKGATDLCDFF